MATVNHLALKAVRITALIVVLSFLIGALVEPNVARADRQFFEKLGRWKVEIFRHSTSKKFTRCAASTVDGYQHVGISISAENLLEIVLFNPKWELDKNSKYKVQYQIDRFPLRKGTIDAINKSGGFIVVNKAEAVYSELKRGYNLYIFGDSNTIKVSLKGTSRALEAVRRCWNRYDIDTTDTSNPFGKAKNDSSDRAKSNIPYDQDSAKGENVDPILMVKFILQSIDDPRFSLNSELPDIAKALDAVVSWNSPGGFGMMNILPMRPDENFAKALVPDDKKACKGTFASGVEKRPFPNTADIVSVKTACVVEDGLSNFIVYTYYPMKGGKSIRTTHISFADEVSREADDLFYKALFQLLSKN